MKTFSIVCPNVHHFLISTAVFTLTLVYASTNYQFAHVWVRKVSSRQLTSYDHAEGKTVE